MKNSVLIVLSFLVFTACSKEELVEPPQAVRPFAFEGNWLGNWSDDLFSGVRVSAKVTKSGDNMYTGSLFIDLDQVGPYIPCCGATNDNGRITFETRGDSVVNYQYIQEAPNYNGGCPGTYRGLGAIDIDINRLVIQFTGEDCDGFHDNGVIYWKLDD